MLSCYILFYILLLLVKKILLKIVTNFVHEMVLLANLCTAIYRESYFLLSTIYVYIFFPPTNYLKIIKKRFLFLDVLHSYLSKKLIMEKFVFNEAFL